MGSGVGSIRVVLGNAEGVVVAVGAALGDESTAALLHAVMAMSAAPSALSVRTCFMHTAGYLN